MQISEKNKCLQKQDLIGEVSLSAYRAQQVLASQEGIRHEETEVWAEEISMYWTGWINGAQSFIRGSTG